MTNRIIDLSERAVRLSVRNALLVIRFTGDPASGESGPGAYRCERLGNPDETTVPLSDIAVLIASHPQVSLSHAVLSRLASAGGVFVACNEKHMPVSMLLPLAAHSLQTERLAKQASVPLPVKKRAWQAIVRAKIRAQSELLLERLESGCGLEGLAARVRSGDPQNIEAQAARIYWRELFGAGAFRRDPDSDGVNACLNYGYAVLRASVARAICGVGLHPSLGIHHHNRYDAFCLADDLMEPFRPLVDREVADLVTGLGKDFPLDLESKRIILRALLGRFTAEGESRTLFDWAARVASSLMSVIDGSGEALEIPAIRPSGAEFPVKVS